MRDINSLTLEECRKIILSIQCTLGRDYTGRFAVWNPDKSWEQETVSYIAETLEEHNLKPTDDDREA